MAVGWYSFINAWKEYISVKNVQNADNFTAATTSTPREGGLPYKSTFERLKFSIGTSYGVQFQTSTVVRV